MFCCCPSLVQSSSRRLRATTGCPSWRAAFQLPNCRTEHNTHDAIRPRTSSHSGEHVCNSDRDTGSNGHSDIRDNPGTNGDSRDDSSHFDAFSQCDSGCCCSVTQFLSIRLRIGRSPNAKQSVCQRVFAEL
jgi:hypothetical protein